MAKRERLAAASVAETSMQVLAVAPAVATPPANDNVDPVAALAELWDRRYKTEGHIWGDEPSTSGIIFAKEMGNHCHGLEFGFGYGRDMLHAIQMGHSMHGIEIAASGYSAADQLLGRHINSGNAFLLRGEFAKAALPDQRFDGILTHRVLHLLGRNGLVTSFAHHAARVLKDNGLLVASARNVKDFKPDQMTMIAEGVAEFKNRPGHIIHFWDEAQFRKVFETNFNIIRFVEGEEIESQSNKDAKEKPVITNFTIMVARKKPKPTLG